MKKKNNLRGKEYIHSYQEASQHKYQNNCEVLDEKEQSRYNINSLFCSEAHSMIDKMPEIIK